MIGGLRDGAFKAALAWITLTVAPYAAAASDLFQPELAQPFALNACRELQPGTYVIPRSDTCLRLTGSIRSEFAIRSEPAPVWGPSAGAAQFRSFSAPRGSGSAISTSAFIAADVRSQTELGPVRIYVSIGRHGRLDHHGDGR